MTLLVQIVFVLITGMLSALATRAVIAALRHRAILDHPNERSSHTMPTPRGGGIALIGVTLPVWAAIAVVTPGQGRDIWPILGAAGLLAVVSWIDDVRNLSPALRLTVQAIAVAIGLSSMPYDMRVFQGLLPPLPDALATAVLWLWFVNLFNFMDGIDGIAGTETICICAGLAAIALTVGAPADAAMPLTLAAAAVGFLVWNWAPARIFLGDVGSVPLGFILGWLLLTAAAKGHWIAALILPLYYLADASVTLLRRLLRGEAIWRAHAQHFYQRAIQCGLSHDRVVLRILVINLLLIALAVSGESIVEAAIPALLGSLAAVVLLLAWLSRDPRPAGDR